MLNQRVLPLFGADSVTTEQKVAFRPRQWGPEVHPGALSLGRLRLFMCKMVIVRLGILTSLTAPISYVISTALKAHADHPTAVRGRRVGAISYPVVVIFLTLSTLMHVVRQGAFRGLRDHFSPNSAFNSAVDVFLGVVNWLYVSPRPKKVKESPVIAKTAEEVDWETILYHGDRRLNCDLRGSADRRRRIAVR